MQVSATKTAWCGKALGLAMVALLLAACGQGGSPGAPAVPAAPPPPVPAAQTVSLFLGGEKSAFVEDAEVRRILADKYGLRLDAIKAGSIEMSTTLDLTGKDAIWPSTDLAADLFRLRGGKAVQTEIVFNSPMVIYTGWNIANALIREGYVEKRDDGYYIVRFRDLLDLTITKKKWKDLGLDFYGHVTIRSTDPSRSNSGNMYAGLVANMLNNGEVVDERQVDTVLPGVKSVFAQLGMMEYSSGDIFQKFIATGVNNSMVVGYENQLVEYLLAHPRQRETILSSVCVLYPQPTVWSSHPVIALNAKGKALIAALRDEEIQSVAWRLHGFRSGLAGVSQDPAVLNIPYVPAEIRQVMPLPTARAMDRILQALAAP